MTTETIMTISKERLARVMLQWEQDARDGKCRSPEETSALPAKQVADENTEHIWQALGAESV